MIANLTDCDGHEQPGTPFGMFFFLDPVLLNDAGDEIQALFEFDDMVSTWTVQFSFKRRFDERSPTSPPLPEFRQ